MLTRLNQSGGIQIESNLQYVYLDFDGESTQYNNSALGLEIDVSVENSKIDAERIVAITAALNERYAETGVTFVTERPTSGTYSTVYIGKNNLGYAGLAETIDSGNQIKNDEAFVNLDSAASDAEIVSVIFHEVDHIVFGADHGGDGIEQYAYVIYYNKTYTGVLTSGLVLSHCSSDYFSEGDPTPVYSNYDKAQNVTINRGGYLIVSSGCTAVGIKINSGGRLCISSGGAVSEIILSGGAIYNEIGSMTLGDNASFTGNSSGAIFNGGSMTLGGNASFTGNSSGAISNGGSMTLGDNASFSGNSGFMICNNVSGSMTLGGNASFSGNSGNTICNNVSGSMTLGDNASFSGNSGYMICNNEIGSMTLGDNASFSGNSGNAIYNTSSGSITLGDSASFSGNSFRAIYNTSSGSITLGGNASFSGNSRGAISNGGSMTLGDNASFTGNSSGAISNGGSMTLGGNASFTGNTANAFKDYAGGGAIYNYGIMTLEGNASFTGNTANASNGSACGGAISNCNIMTLTSAAFTGNTAITSSGHAGGGAIYNCDIMTLTSAAFTGNTANDSSGDAAGGAIYNWGGSMTLTSAAFTGNTAITSSASAWGGAIYNYGSMTLTSAAFTGNTAITSSGSAWGGAIYNYGSMTLTSAAFTGNTAITSSRSACGGAIYNHGIMTLTSAVFTGNTVNASSGSSYGGAIYNLSTVALKDCRFETYTDTVNNLGVMTVEETVSFAGNVTLYSAWGGCNLVNNGTIDFNIAPREEGDGILLNDWTCVYGNGDYTITVSDKQVSGDYQLIGNAADFDMTITVKNESGSTKGELSLDMSKPLKLKNMSLMLVLDEETDIISVKVDSDYSKGTDRENQETKVELPEAAFLSFVAPVYELKQAPEWLSMDRSTGKFSGKTGMISDTETGYGTTSVVVVATEANQEKEHTIELVVVPEKIEGDGRTEGKSGATMTDVLAVVMANREERGSFSVECDDVDWSYQGLELQISDMSATLTVTDTEYEVKLQGNLSLSIFHAGKSGGDDPRLTVDLSEDRYIKITTPQDFGSIRFDIVGDLTFHNLNLADGFFLKEGVISVNSETQRWYGSAEIEFAYFDKTVFGEYEVLEKKVNKISVSVDGLDILMGTSGFVLTALRGGVEHLSDGQSVTFNGGADFSYGKEITIGGGAVSLAKVELNGSINSKRISGAADLTVLGGFLTGSVSAELNWATGMFQAAGSLNLMKIGTISSSLKIDTAGNFMVSASREFDFSEYGLNFSALSTVTMQYLNDANASNDYYSVSTSQELFGHTYFFGVKFHFDGTWQLINYNPMEEPANEEAQPLLQTFSTFPTADDISFSAMAAEEPAAQSWNLTGEEHVVLLTASWTGEGAEVTLTDAAGIAYSLSEIQSAQNFAVVERMSSTNRIAIAVNAPDAGVWSLTVGNVGEVKMNAVSLGEETALAAPDLSVEMGEARQITLSWSKELLPAEATITLYYDNDQAGYDG
ncbi:MAG: hypothetical protein PHS41_03300, partial [Victivallaceae bacterium]|nr:hypothetical protein [Victivallaceae bacterium]